MTSLGLFAQPTAEAITAPALHSAVQPNLNESLID
jgi:hypothetical protein